MVILETDHPVIVAAELEVRLPEAVAVFSLKTFCSPCFPRLGYGVIQAGFTYDPVGYVVVDDEAFVLEVAGYLVWTPTVPFP
jgi:hypothetical protein